MLNLIVKPNTNCRDTLNDTAYAASFDQQTKPTVRRYFTKSAKTFFSIYSFLSNNEMIKQYNLILNRCLQIKFFPFFSMFERPS